MADLDVETTIKPVSTVNTQPHSRHSSDIGEPTEISRRLSKLERIMEAIASHVGLLEPDAQHAEEMHVSHIDDQVQEGGSQDGFSNEDFTHPNSDLACNSISCGGKRILPEEFLDSETSRKQKLSEFSENFDCDQEPNQFQFYHPPSDSPPKWPISEHIDQYFKKYFFSSGLDNKTYNEIKKDIGLPDGTFSEAPEVNASIANFKSMSTNKGIQIGDDILKKVQNHLMSSFVVMLKLWQALQDGESLSEEDIFGCIQRNIVLSGSAFSMLSQFKKTDSREFCRKNMPVFVVNLIEAQRMRPNLQKIYLEIICLKKFLKFLKRISCLNKLQNLHLITASLTAVKVFSLFTKAPSFSHNQFLRKPKPGAIPNQGESFSDQSQKEELQIQKRNLPLNRENQILSGKLVQINFRQDCFTNDNRTSNSFPILSKTTENNPSNSPSFEGRIRNIKSRNSILKRQRCHHGNSFSSSKVYKLTLCSPKTLRGETTCDKPCSSEQLHLQSTIQDGRFRKSQILTKPRGLFREDRSFRWLSIHSSPRRLTTIPGIYFRPGHICFQNDAIRAKRGTSSIYKGFQTSFGRSEGTVYSSSHMARRYPSNLKFLFKLHSRLRHCYGPTSEPRFLIKHGKVSPHSNSESHLPRYGDRFVNHDIFFSGREGFSNCSKCNNSKKQESGISKGNLPVCRNVLGYSPCSKGSSNPLSTASTPSDNLTERKFTFKKPMLLSEIHASPPCPARSGLVDRQSFHLNFKSNYTSSSRHLHSDRRFRPGVGRLPETPKDFGNVDKEPTFLAHKQKGIDGNFSQSKVFPKIPGECPCSNYD